MGERALTVRDRIIVHLSAFGRFAEEYECPEDMCQSGISLAMGKSRAHITLELNRMREAGLVSERNAHIKGAKSRRKTYLLTPVGMTRFMEIDRYLDDMKIEIVEAGGSRFLSGNEAADYLKSIFNISRIMAVDSVLASGGILTVSPQSVMGTKGADDRHMPPRPDDYQPRKEMKALAEILEEENPNTVILLGIHGIGKSTLLSELAWSLDGIRPVMYRRLYPYDSARSVLADIGGFLNREGFPSLLRMISNPTQFDLAEAAFSICCTLQKKRFVLILDGYEQTPETMGPLFSMLGEQVRDSGSCLIISSATKGDFYSLKNLALEGHIREITLGPMGRKEAAGMLGKSGEDGKKILEMAAGHPLTIKLLDSGIGAETLAEFVEDEMLGKDTYLARLCRFVSVLRKPFMLSDLELFGFKSADQARHNLAFEPQPGGGYLLHPAISSIMIEAAGGRMLSDFHSRAADFYGETGDCAHERLHHLTLAGRTAEAGHLMIEKGDELLRTGNTDELAKIMGQLVSGNYEMPGLELLAARVFNFAGRWEMANNMAKAIIEKTPGTQEAARASVILANIAAKTGNLKQSLEVLDAIRKAGMKADVKAEVYYASATALRRLGRTEEALEASRKAITWAGKAGNEMLLGQCLMENAMIMSYQGDQEGALKSLDRVNQIFSEGHSDPDLARCHINRGMVLGLMGRDAEAVSVLESAVKMAEDAGLYRVRAHGLVNLTDMLNSRKEYRRSGELAEEAVKIFAGLGEPLMQAAAMFNLSRAKAGLGMKEDAISVMEKALELLKEHGLLAGRPEWVSECADMLREMGEEGMAAKLMKKYGRKPKI